MFNVVFDSVCAAITRVVSEDWKRVGAQPGRSELQVIGSGKPEWPQPEAGPRGGSG